MLLRLRLRTQDWRRFRKNRRPGERFCVVDRILRKVYYFVVRQITGTHFFKSFSDGLFRAFRGSRAAGTIRTSGEGGRAEEPSHSQAQTRANVIGVNSVRGWLGAFPWEKVLTLNQGQCELQNTQTTPNPKTYDGVKAQWEQRIQRNMSLGDALDFCRECEQKAPFVFSNKSTFSQVGRGVVDDLVKSLPSVEAHIVRNTVAHYVTGTVSKKELFDVLQFYEAQWRPGLEKISGNGVGHRPQEDA
jgi:hypothetical protein